LACEVDFADDADELGSRSSSSEGSEYLRHLSRKVGTRERSRASVDQEEGTDAIENWLPRWKSR